MFVLNQTAPRSRAVTPLSQVFNTALAAAFPHEMIPGIDPVVNVNLHSDGRYAFVEFRTPQMATSALSLNGQVQLGGAAISCGRPTGYIDPLKAQQAAVTAGHALVAFQGGALLRRCPLL